MQDESLIDEIRAALEGDRERAALRRRSAGPVPLAPSPDPAPAGREASVRAPRVRLSRLLRLPRC